MADGTPQESDPLFRVHRLNQRGLQNATDLAFGFTDLLELVEGMVGPEGSTGRAMAARDLAIVRTKLQEACFFAKRAMALNPDNQENGQ